MKKLKVGARNTQHTIQNTDECNIILYEQTSELCCHHVRVKRPALVFGPLCCCSELPTIHKTHSCCFGRPYRIHISIVNHLTLQRRLHTALILHKNYSRCTQTLLAYLQSGFIAHISSWLKLSRVVCVGIMRKTLWCTVKPVSPVTFSLEIHSGLLHAANHPETIEDSMDVFNICSNRHRQVSNHINIIKQVLSF